MAQPLPRLRTNLDFMPSPIEDRPGLLVRDPYHYSDATLLLPMPLVACVGLFDGSHSELDLRQALVEITGDLEVGELQAHLTQTLSAAGFLEDDTYLQMREEREREFAGAGRREAAHAGGAYPEELQPLRDTLAGYLDGDAAQAPAPAPAAIAAPHVSPEGGYQSYRSAYRLITPELRDRTIIILGTSHYGNPERFGLTRKNFATPFGEARTDTRLVDWLEKQAPDSVLMEDYCHAVEHSIEFQVVFLQHLLGPDIRILPILCGSYARSLYDGGAPEDDERVRRFLGALGELNAREGNSLFWVLGVDMAHMGRRYGDQFAAIAGAGEMAETEDTDRRRIDRLTAGDPEGFWDLVQHNADPLKWCGSSPFYTFLRACPGMRGELESYEQWNIDDQSVVSFAGMSFHRE